MVLAALLATPALAADGKLRFVRNATSSFDSYTATSSDAQREWMAAHYFRMRGYAPYFNQALGWAPTSHFYKDLYAIYRDVSSDQQLMADHPSWVLRDSSGNRLFIPWSCNGTTCTQYAADIGSPQWRAHWINQAKTTMGAGYDGIFVDDVNLEMKVGNGSGAFVRPVDPRTGAAMTDADWRRYMAEFTEEIKAAFPGAEIVHNALWWASEADPYVQREIDAADVVELERGFNDPGIVGGTSKFGYETLLAHVDWLHSRGASVLLEPYGLTATSREFELASYFLAKAADDAVVSDFQADPGNWWPGWETDLGAPAGGRYLWNGLLRRDFAAGMVLANQPGQATKSVTPPGGSSWVDLAGNPVTSVTLDGRRGKVLRLAGATSEPAPEPAPTGDTNTPPGKGKDKPRRGPKPKG